MLRHAPLSTRLPYTTLFRSHLVGGQRDQVAGGERHGDPAEALHGVAEQQGTLGAGETANLLDRLDHADLVIDQQDRKSTRLNSSHSQISYAVFRLKKKTSSA